MKLTEKCKLEYIQQKEDKLNGKLNGIPLFYTFPKLGSIIKSIPKGYPILWSANSGVGKSQTWIGIFVYSIYKLKKDYPDVNLKIKLVIALLEDTKEMFIDRLFSMLLYEMYKIKVDTQDLHSLKENPISDDIIEKLDSVQKEIDFILEDCEIADSIYNPTGIFKWTRSISNKYGKHHNKTVIFTDDDGKTEEKEIYSHYELNDPDMQVLMVLDNLNNLSQEKRDSILLTERGTINLWTRNYCRLQMTKHWKWSVINIIQQASDSESSQYTNKGEIIINKIKPSLSGLGNSKECQRDHFLVFGLFAPDRYGVNTYEGYDITQLKDNFRSLIILKSNISKTNIELPLYFDGSCSLVKELPEPNKLDYVKLRKNKHIK